MLPEGVYYFLYWIRMRIRSLGASTALIPVRQGLSISVEAYVYNSELSTVLVAGLFDPLRSQPHLSCSFGRMPSVDEIFPLHGQATSFSEHRTSPSRGRGINCQPLCLPDKDGETPWRQVTSPAQDEFLQPLICNVLKVPR